MLRSKSEKNFLIELMIAGDRELSDFLQSRPCDEELGESLDRYKQYLKGEGLLTEDRIKEIQCVHIHYLSDLLVSDLPIKRISEIDICEDAKIKDFCEDQDFLNNVNLNEDHLREFAEAYKSVDSLYVNYNMAKIMLRYHIMDKAQEYYDKALKSILFSTAAFWNNKESLYAGSELLFDIVSNELFINNVCDDSLLSKVLEYTYMILSRVVLWNDNYDDRFDDFDVPITYHHRISSFNKRAEMLLKHKEYFRNLTPSYSTPETLAVADYSSAHDLSFSGNQTGSKSLFKLDAGKLYSDIANQDIRPYNTAILDGKKDSVELAHRFYLKYSKNKYLLNNEEYSYISQLLKDIVSKRDLPINNDDEKLIRQYLLDNGIEYFYHFTERENIENIKKNGGICSFKYCLLHAIEVCTQGELMTTLRDTDASFGLEDYARLSFCERHPLIKKRQESGADLVVLKIKVDVAWRCDTLFSDRDAAKRHHHGSTIDDLRRVRMNAIRKTNLEEWDPDYDFNQAEVMVKSIVPLEYIVNIDNPTEISTVDSSTAKDTEITKNKLTKAINTIVILSELFKNSSFLTAAKDGRNEKKKLTMYSFAGILGYLYEEDYQFGYYSSLVDNAMLQHYANIKLSMDNPDNREKAISDLANNWSDILQTILEIKTYDNEDSRAFIELQTEIDNVTNIMEILSGSKCRKPIIGYANDKDTKISQFNRDPFTHVVEEAEYNPFQITADPTLQNFPPLPGDFKDTFRTELFSLYNVSGRQRNSEMEIFFSYVYSLVQSYYNNAGYVPKNTIDAIVEQCHQSVRGTSFGWHLPSLDEMKYKVYLSLFSRRGVNDPRLYQRYGFLM